MFRVAANATYLEVHHLDLRSEGGGNEPDNVVVLCGAHHGALHRGRLRIDGKVSTGLRFSHAGTLVSPEDRAGQPRTGALERAHECHGRDAAALGRRSRQLPLARAR